MFSDTFNFSSNYSIFNAFINNNSIWNIVKTLFIISLITSNLIIFSYVFCFVINKKSTQSTKVPIFGLLIGCDLNGNKIYIPEKSLYQNILITGSIGSGKTSSAMYPFTKQLIEYECYNINKKLGFLILDVKGNYYAKVLEFAKNCNRLNDVVVIEINGKYHYNPLDKPYLKSSVLANRLKTILLLFSPNNSEDYWLDMCEHILESMIDLCRIYNKGYVTFEEIHKLCSNYDYYCSKISCLRKIFQSGKLNYNKCYLLYHAISFLESDYFGLDSRTFNILKSEITRITNCFVSDYEIKKTFCPSKKEENFYGFDDCIKNGKIVVLNMNIAQYKNLSKIIAAYLKLDFQTDVLKQLSKSPTILRPSAFISDEYQEYVTSSDASFFSQSRESKCINIVSSQSYTSIVNTLHDEHASKVIIQNLINKLWFRTDDIFTIEEAQKQIGKEEKKKLSKTISESSKESNYSYVSNNFISYGSNISESINSYSQNEFVYDYNFFTQKLSTFSCLSFLSNGDIISKPQKINMFPYFLNNNTNN